jgi:hypothetical protein
VGVTWDDVSSLVVALLRDGRDEEAWAAVDEAASGLETRWPAPTAGFREVGRELYWTHQALPEYIRLQREQIRRLDAEPGPESDVAVRLVGALYDLASFAWPGWGKDVRAEHAALGAEAADRALRLREAPGYANLEFTVTPGMAHWVVGAHALAARDFERARAELALSGDETLARGYLGLVDLAEAGDRSELDSVLDELAAKDDEDSVFYRDQLVAASGALVGAG